MNLSNFFQGQIDIGVTEPEFKTDNVLNFNRYGYRKSPKVNPKLGETLMYKFKSLKFEQDEKQQLNHEIRKLIYTIQNIHPEKLQEDAEKFADYVKKMKGEKIELNAYGYGGFICLTCMFNQLFETPFKEITINLHDVPLNLFPKKFMRKKGISQFCHIRHTITKDNWLAPFKTLWNLPEDKQKIIPYTLEDDKKKTAA